MLLAFLLFFRLDLAAVNDFKLRGIAHDLLSSNPSR
jgi:hypothetical protein